MKKETKLWEKKSRKDDSRALMPDELGAFLGEKEKNPLQGYVQLVKDRPELELCLRGNSESNPRVNIYCNNHIIFTIYVTGKVGISFNHARYCKNWKSFYRTLIDDFGFNGSIKKVKEGISVGEMTRTLQNNAPMNRDQISKLYDEVIKPIFDRYFEVEGKSNIVDYFKTANSDGDQEMDKEGSLIEKKVKVSGKTEKRVQQRLYNQFTFTEGGYFFYDLEFAQRHSSMEDQRKDKNNNKPDMLALRFDAEGKPERIVFVEVKSTEAAMKGTSGIVEHLKKMRKYDKLPERRLEACQIMNQYASLGLRGLTRNNSYNLEDFKDLPLEALLVFTGDAATMWENNVDFEADRDMTKRMDAPEGVDAKLYSFEC